MTFRDDLLDDAKHLLLDTEELAEEVVYYQQGVTTAGRRINAVIRRFAEERLQRGPGLRAAYEMIVSKDPEEGVGTPDANRDLFDFPLRRGGANKRWKLAEVLDEFSDGETWRLRLQAGPVDC